MKATKTEWVGASFSKVISKDSIILITGRRLDWDFPRYLPTMSLKSCG